VWPSGCIGRRYLDVARTAWLSPLRATPWYPRRPYERALARSATPLNSALEQGLPPQSRYIARLARGGMPRVAGLDLAGRPADFRPRPGADEGERRPALTTARLTGCGATVICCSGAGLPTEGSVQEGFADHVEQLSKVITYTPPPGRHSSAVEQLFRKSPPVLRSATSVADRYKQAHLSAFRSYGLPE
jgi:hypothetical protein